MANIYLGKDSCYARRGLKYCKKKGRKGIDSKEEVDCIIRKILNELRKGWTFNHECKRIRMTRKLAERRLIFLVRLACTHGGKRICEYAKKRVKQVLKRIRR